MRQFINIVEAISDLRTIGDMDNTERSTYGLWQPGDSGLLKSPKGVGKIEDLFRRTKQDFNLYVIFPSARKQFFPRVTAMCTEVDVDVLSKALGYPVDTTGKITMVYFNNVAGRYGMPMNAWTMAHRLGHGLQLSIPRRPECHDAYDTVHHELALVYNEWARNKLGQSGYMTGKGSHLNVLSAWNSQMGQDFLEFLMDLMTMKSARDRHLVSADLEAFCELIAQYLIGGRVRFNRLPGIEELCVKAEENVNNAFDELLEKLVGHVLSM